MHNGDNCSSVDDIVDNCNSVSVSDLDQNSILVFPNPVNNNLSIQSEYSTSAIILDLHGRTIKRLNIIGGLNIIDVSDLESGSYFLHVLNGHKEVMIKI